MNGMGGLMRRVASAGLMLQGAGMGGMPPAKKQCLEYVQLAPPPQTTVYQSTIYAAPEIVAHQLLGAGGSGRLPDRLPLSPGGELAVVPAAAQPPQQPLQQQPAQQQHEGSGHGGGSYLQHLTGSGDPQLFGPWFPGDAGGGEGDATSPRHHLQQRQAAALLPALAAPTGAGSGGDNGYHPQSPKGDRREGSADNREREVRHCACWEGDAQPASQPVRCPAQATAVRQSAALSPLTRAPPPPRCPRRPRAPPPRRPPPTARCLSR